MDRESLQRLLIKAAICTIACDGEIHEKEIMELGSIISSSQYFASFEDKQVLAVELAGVKADGTRYLVEFFSALSAADLSSVQELLLLEIVLRIVNADGRFDENELVFLKAIRSRMRVYDEIIVQRFGEVPYLVKGDNNRALVETDNRDHLSSISANVSNVEFKDNCFNDILSSMTSSVSPPFFLADEHNSLQFEK